MNVRVSVLVVEDHAMVRAGICALLGRENDIDILAEADNVDDALQIACSKKPDVVLMDLNLHGRSGFDAITEIKRCVPTTKILVVTMHATHEYVQTALRRGASGYILKESGHEELIIAIRKVAAGKIYLSAELSEGMISKMVSVQQMVDSSSSLGSLTLREREVLKIVAKGESNKQVARCLNLSIKTVEKHRSNVMHKLGLRNVASLVAYAISNGLVDS